MKTKTLSLALLMLILAGTIIWFEFFRSTEEQVTPIQNDIATTTPQPILTFEDCVEAGYPVVENVRRQCSTQDGRTFAEEVRRQALLRCADQRERHRRRRHRHGRLRLASGDRIYDF